MGSFKKLFGKKEPEPRMKKDIRVSTNQEEWDFYFSNVDSVIGSFYIDLGLIHIVPMIDKPNLVWVSLRMNNPSEDGLSSNEEFEKLFEIEKRLQEYISREHNSVYAGRLTSNNRRVFYFYCGNVTFYDKTISEAMAVYSSYDYDFGFKEDKQWESYCRFMYPSPRQYQSLQNRRVVDNLRSSGDSLKKKRQVDHWIYFKTSKGRQLFLTRIKNTGFDIVNEDVVAENSVYPYLLHITREDKVDLDSVNEYTLYLWELAGECDGDYDGWETSVEKNDECE